MGTTFLTSAMIGLAILPAPIAGSALQSEIQVEYNPCAGCKIEVAPAGLWSGDWLDRAADVVPLGDDRFAFVPSNHRVELLIVSSAGDLIRRIGRRGEGPGEYDFLQFVRPMMRGSGEDGLQVFDLGRRRRTALGSDFAVRWTAPVPLDQLWDVVVLADGYLLANGFSYTPDRVGLHLIDREGIIERYFDRPPGGYDANESTRIYRRALRLANDGSVWSASTTKYRIEKWDPITGVKLATTVRPADWFPDHDGSMRSNDPDNPPSPRLIDVMEDSANRLWVMIRVASERWQDAFEKVPEGSHPELGARRIRDDHVAYDTVLEVIDWKRGRVLARTVVDEALAFMGGGWASSYHEDDVGTPTRQLFKLQFNSPSSR